MFSLCPGEVSDHVSLAEMGARICLQISLWWDFPGGAVVKNLPANAGGTGSNPGVEDPTYRGATKPVCHNC